MRWLQSCRRSPQVRVQEGLRHLHPGLHQHQGLRHFRQRQRQTCLREHLLHPRSRVPPQGRLRQDVLRLFLREGQQGPHVLRLPGLPGQQAADLPRAKGRMHC